MVMGEIKQPTRLWLPPSNEKEIIFLDGGGSVVYEHSGWNPTKNKPEFYTCLSKGRGGNGVVQPKGVCPFCDKGVLRTESTPYSVLDCTPWKNKEGKEFNFGRKLLMAKWGVNQKILFRKKMRGSLVGVKYLLVRYGEKSAITGDDFEFVEKIDLSSLEKSGVNVKVFNYDEVFKPIDKESCASLANSDLFKVKEFKQGSIQSKPVEKHVEVDPEVGF